jgi:hypothetical protein
VGQREQELLRDASCSAPLGFGSSEVSRDRAYRKIAAQCHKTLVQFKGSGHRFHRGTDSRAVDVSSKIRDERLRGPP